MRSGDAPYDKYARAHHFNLSTRLIPHVRGRTSQTAASEPLYFGNDGGGLVEHRKTPGCAVNELPPSNGQKMHPVPAAAYQVRMLVLPGSTELDLTLHQELFRVANGLLSKSLFRVDILTIDDRNVTLANGREIMPTASFNLPGECALSIVLSHINPDPALAPAINSAIRKLAKTSTLIAAADQAPLLLASAGLLDGRIATCHVDLMLAAQESYPAVEFVDQLWIRDGDILTYPGHLSTVDTMVEYIGEILGAEFAEALSAELISHSPRSPRLSQRSTRNAVEGTSDLRVQKAVDIMRSHIEAPLSIPAIAEKVGVSTRSLEVLWRNVLGSSPQLFYMRERINHSCSLLLFSGLSITEISCACGFSSGASFSRAFADLTGLSPREYRRKHGNKIAPAVLLKNRITRRAQSVEAVANGAATQEPRSTLKGTRVS